jgi:Acetyltransferase (GNAT) domain
MHMPAFELTDPLETERLPRPLLAVAFDALGLHRVIGRLEPRNTGSARVLEKLGMRCEAHFVENEFVKEEWQSELVYAILAREWRARPGPAAPGPDRRGRESGTRGRGQRHRRT